MAENGNSDKTPTPSEQYINDYFQGLTTIIDGRAQAIAQEQGRKDVQARDVAQACSEIAPGSPFPTEQNFWQRIGSNITGITVISAALAIIFGAIGFAVLRWGGPEAAESVTAFIDIAQIFAGAVVGSTGAAAVTGR